MKSYSMKFSGILFPVSAWPNETDAIGTLGQSAFILADWLAAAGQKFLQILPLGPTGFGNSPFDGPALEAGNHYFIDLDMLRAAGDISEKQLIEYVRVLPPDKMVAYGFLWYKKLPLLKSAGARFFKNILKKKSARTVAFNKFIRQNRHWLEPAALFLALKDYHGGRGWNEWGRYKKPFKNISQYPAEIQELTKIYLYLQWQFQTQWQNMSAYFRQKGISIIGDMPAYAAFDSADVWAHQKLFHLDKNGAPLFIAGVPPDYFSTTGQRWGNPLPRWHRLEKARIIKSKYRDESLKFPKDPGFKNVLNMVSERFDRLFRLVDYVKIDHFRGLAGYGVVPAEDKTAGRCRWVAGSGPELLAGLKKSRGRLNLLAEDLGVITPEVENLRKKFKIPGMVIFQFAGWGGPNIKNDKYFPANYRAENVAYPGTHDNDTFSGWLNKLAKPPKKAVIKYLMENPVPIKSRRAKLVKKKSIEKSPNWLMATKISNSKAGLAIFPIQDMLELGSSARLNTPGTFSRENWAWRCDAGRLSKAIAEKMRRLSQQSGRV